MLSPILRTIINGGTNFHKLQLRLFSIKSAFKQKKNHIEIGPFVWDLRTQRQTREFITYLFFHRGLNRRYLRF